MRAIDALHTIQRRATACVPAATSSAEIVPDESLFVALVQVAVSSVRICELAAREQDSSASVRQLKIQSTSTESTSVRSAIAPATSSLVNTAQHGAPSPKRIRDPHSQSVSCVR